MSSALQQAFPATSSHQSPVAHLLNPERHLRKIGARWCILLAGGEGTRLRSLTRFISGDDRPKQFCSLFGDGTLLEHSLQRAERSVAGQNILVALTSAHEDYYRGYLGKALCHRMVQPDNRGTAPPLICSLLNIAKKDPCAIVAVLPTDHYYSDEGAFTRSLEDAFRLAEASDSVVLLGARASNPEVEYGWIETGARAGESAFQVVRFHEKPSVACAQRLLQGGALWNTFVMVGAVSTFLEMAWKSIPKLMLAFGSEFKGVRRSGETIIHDSFYAAIPTTDFSRHVLTHNTDRLIAIPLQDFEWHDLGHPERVVSTVLNHKAEVPEWVPRWRSLALPVTVGEARDKVNQPAIGNDVILVVDDSQEVRALVQSFLEDDGYTVLTASHGEEGLRTFNIHQSRIGLLLTDVNMPNMGGFELAGRALSLRPDLPVLFMSGAAHDVDSPGQWIGKPFEKSDLVRRVRESLSSKVDD